MIQIRNTDLEGSLLVDPGGETDQLRLVTWRLLQLSCSNLKKIFLFNFPFLLQYGPKQSAFPRFNILHTHFWTLIIEKREENE